MSAPSGVRISDDVHHVKEGLPDGRGHLKTISTAQLASSDGLMASKTPPQMQLDRRERASS
jgi:hypothetical protein